MTSEQRKEFTSDPDKLDEAVSFMRCAATVEEWVAWADERLAGTDMRCIVRNGSRPRHPTKLPRHVLADRAQGRTALSTSPKSIGSPPAAGPAPHPEITPREKTETLLQRIRGSSCKPR